MRAFIIPDGIFDKLKGFKINGEAFALSQNQGSIRLLIGFEIPIERVCGKTPTDVNHIPAFFQDIKGPAVYKLIRSDMPGQITIVRDS